MSFIVIDPVRGCDGGPVIMRAPALAPFVLAAAVLAKQLDYDFAGRSLIIRDVDADVVVDCGILFRTTDAAMRPDRDTQTWNTACSAARPIRRRRALPGSPRTKAARSARDDGYSALLVATRIDFWRLAESARGELTRRVCA